MGQQHSRRSRSLSGSQRSRLGSSERSRERGGLSRTKSVHENLVRERGKKVLIEDVYEVLGKIGHGALCEIYKLQKNKDKIGGSSRPELQRKKVLDFGRFLSYNDTMKLRKEESFQLNPLYFALKVINLKKVKEDKIDQLKNEIECVQTSSQIIFLQLVSLTFRVNFRLLRTMDHMNIIKAYETFQDKASKKLMIVMELCTGGDLYERLPYSEEQAATIAKQILSAVSYMHQRNIIHRDIKMENVIYESKQPDALIKLIDFGLSKE
jgi:serine/threonine protein kinase